MIIRLIIQGNVIDVRHLNEIELNALMVPVNSFILNNPVETYTEYIEAVFNNKEVFEDLWNIIIELRDLEIAIIDTERTYNDNNGNYHLRVWLDGSLNYIIEYAP